MRRDAAKVFETPEECLNGAIGAAEKIASYSRVAVKAGKEVVNKSQDLGIREGVEFERRVFHSLFGSKDQKIGMFLLRIVTLREILTNVTRYDRLRRKEKGRVVPRVNVN